MGVEVIDEMPGGSVLVAGYYAAGPALAAVVEGHEIVRSVLARLLFILAGFAMLLMWIGPAGLGAGLGGSVLTGLLAGLVLPRHRRAR